MRFLPIVPLDPAVRYLGKLFPIGPPTQKAPAEPVLAYNLSACLKFIDDVKSALAWDMLFHYRIARMRSGEEWTICWLLSLLYFQSFLS